MALVRTESPFEIVGAAFVVAEVVAAVVAAVVVAVVSVVMIVHSHWQSASVVQ